ncbi:unnamed protein product, partial [Rotaria magnacalcarata]
MSLPERKRNSVLNPSLLQSITQAFSQSRTTVSSPSDDLAKLTVNTPTTCSSIEVIHDVPRLITREEPQLLSEEQTPLTPLLTLKHEFQYPTQTPRRSSNFLKGCK